MRASAIVHPPCNVHVCRWGAMRAGMGRSEPWDLKYVTLGNEECLRPWYLQVRACLRML